jgi:hypothetical protein
MIILSRALDPGHSEYIGITNLMQLCDDGIPHYLTYAGQARVHQRASALAIPTNLESSAVAMTPPEEPQGPPTRALICRYSRLLLSLIDRRVDKPRFVEHAEQNDHGITELCRDCT